MRYVKRAVGALFAAVMLLCLAACSVFGGGGNEEEKYVSVAYSPGDFFVTNIKDSNKLLKSEVVLNLTLKEDPAKAGSPDPRALTKIKDANHLIRERIIEVLRLKTEDYLRRDEAIANLRDEIADDLRDALSIDTLTSITFLDFVFQ